MLHVELHKQLGAFQLDVAFETDGDILALLGASGCGKSMTLKCIAGIETPEKLRQSAQLRLENPEATLQELADMMDPPMKKSGLNNRFRKIEELAGKL